MSAGFTRIELEFCKEFTEKLFKHPLAIAFQRPVNPQLDNAVGYLEKIQRPMDLGTIKANLENNVYANSKAWVGDIKLVWFNAKTYNQRKQPIYEAAERLSQKCEKVWKAIPKTDSELWGLKLAKVNQKMRTFLREKPPDSSLIPRNAEFMLKLTPDPSE
jgi:hypothetical protein